MKISKHLAPAIRFIRIRLFATPLDAVITLACCWFIARIAPLLGLQPRFELPPADKLILASAGGR